MRLAGRYALCALASPLAVLGAAAAICERLCGGSGETGLWVARPFLRAVELLKFRC